MNEQKIYFMALNRQFNTISGTAVEKKTFVAGNDYSVPMTFQLPQEAIDRFFLQNPLTFEKYNEVYKLADSENSTPVLVLKCCQLLERKSNGVCMYSALDWGWV